MNIIPPTMIYLPVIKSVINSISFRITDESNNTLDFRNEEISLAIHLQQV
jgi:hypothetical protein